MKLGEVNRKTSERSLPGNLIHPQVRSFVRNRARRVLELMLPKRFQPAAPPPQRPMAYEPPRLARLTPEQAKLKLLGHLSVGDQGAMDLLDLMFPEPVVDLATPERCDGHPQGEP